MRGAAVVGGGTLTVPAGTQTRSNGISGLARARRSGASAAIRCVGRGTSDCPERANKRCRSRSVACLRVARIHPPPPAIKSSPSSPTRRAQTASSLLPMCTTFIAARLGLPPVSFPPLPTSLCLPRSLRVHFWTLEMSICGSTAPPRCNQSQSYWHT